MTTAIRGPHVRIEVPADIRALSAVRRQVVAVGLAWALTGVAELEIVASELVTNAVVHAGTPSVLDCGLLAPGFVEVSVADTGPGEPRLRHPDADDVTGRGLRIVEALSTTWGVETTTGPGKTVWARLGRPW